MRECPYCQREVFGRRFYCNDECKRKYKLWEISSLKVKEDITERFCLNCDVEFKPDTRFIFLCDLCGIRD